MGFRRLVPMTASIEPNLLALAQGIDLLRSLPRAAYARAATDGGLPGVGPHFRHCIDFYRSFLEGLERREIDYDARSRTRDLETDRDVALAEMERVAVRLGSLAEARDEPVRVRTHGGWSGSTVQRELEALVSHTIHHYALIALALRWTGHEVPSEFGVSPSTLEHWRREGRCAR